jgi:hypothetical protein
MAMGASQASRDMWGGMRPDTVRVRPVDGITTMAFQTWEHQCRMDRAVKSEQTSRTIRSMEASMPRCEICGVSHPFVGAKFGLWSRARSLCNHCAAAVDLAGAQRHLTTHQAQVDTWLDRHSPRD